MYGLTYIPTSFASMEMRARVCMCIGLCSGIDSFALADALGITHHTLVSDYLTELVRAELVGRKRKGNTYTYHARKAGNKLVRREKARLAAESLGVISRLKNSGRVRSEDVAVLERALLGVV